MHNGSISTMILYYVLYTYCYRDTTIITSIKCGFFQLYINPLKFYHCELCIGYNQFYREGITFYTLLFSFFVNLVCTWLIELKILAIKPELHRFQKMFWIFNKKYKS